MTTDPIATARALIAAQPDLLFRCDLCPDEFNCHPHHDMSMSGEYILCDGCEDFDNPAGVPDPLKLIATLADAVEVGQADAEKWREAAGAHHVAAMREAEKWIAVSAERDGLHAELAKTLLQTGDLKIALARTQAQVAAAYGVAAGACALMAEEVADAAITGLPEQARLRESMEAAYAKATWRIRALTPADAQAALDKLLAEARLEGWRAGRDAAADELEIQALLQALVADHPNVEDISRAIRAMPEPKEASHE